MNNSKYPSNFKAFKKFIKNLDYFGIGQNLRVNNNSKYQSKFGGMIFILYFMFAIGYFFYYFIGFVSKQNKSVISNDLVVQPAPDLNLTELKFNFAFAITYDNDTMLDSHFIDDYLNIDLVYQIHTLNGKKETTPIKLRKCKYSDFHFMNSSSFDILFLSSYLCMDSNQYNIGGLPTEEIYKFLKLKISIKNTEIIKENILKNILQHNSIKSTIYFVDTFIDVESIDYPVNNFLNSYFTYLDYFQNKKVALDYMLFEFFEDTNFIFSDPIEGTFIKYFWGRDFGFTILDRETEQDLEILSILFRPNANKKIISRSFQKIPDFLANLSGILSNLLVLLYIIMTFINEFKLTRSMINKIIRFREAIVQQKDITNKINEILIHSKLANISIGKKNINFKNDLSQMNILDLENNKINQIPGDNKNSKMLNFVIPEDHSNSVEPRIRNKNDNEEIDIISDEKVQHYQIFKNNISNFLKKEYNPVISVNGEINKPVKLSFVSYLLCNCSKNNKYKSKLYDIGQDQLHYYTDIITIIKKLQELDLFKYLLFDEDQITLINFLSKPIISINGEENKEVYNDYYKDSLNKEMNITIEELNKIKASYISILSDRKKNDDSTKVTKLISFFEDKLAHLKYE